MKSECGKISQFQAVSKSFVRRNNPMRFSQQRYPSFVALYKITLETFGLLMVVD